MERVINDWRAQIKNYELSRCRVPAVTVYGQKLVRRDLPSRRTLRESTESHWCPVVEQTSEGMTAEVGIAFSGIRQTFVTRNTHEAGKRVQMHLVKGPFSRLDGDWHFHPVGDGTQRACKVELLLNYGFDSAALAALVGPVFDRIAGSMVDAFVKRAEQVYG